MAPGRRNPGKKMPMVRSVHRAARIMESLFLAPEGKHLVEISQELGLHKTTVLRLLRTLVTVGMIEREPTTDHYRWDAMTWITIASNLREVMARGEHLDHILRDLANTVGATVVLAVPDVRRRRMILADYAQPPGPVRLDPTARRALPMNATMAGKVYLAQLSEDELNEWLQGPLPALTPNTITDPARLREDLRLVRERGYALSSQEALLGVSGVAVAVLDSRGRAAGALGLVIGAEALAPEQVAPWLPDLYRVAISLPGLVYAPVREDVHRGPGRRHGTGSGQAGSVEARPETLLHSTCRMV